MIRLFKYLTMTMVTSLYLFPVTTRYLPGVNSKMMLAVIGLALYLVNLARKRRPEMSGPMIQLSAIALLVSLCGFFSVTYNNTNDWAYATYIVSMWVWVGGAYAVLCMIRAIHGWASVGLVINYLMAVAVFQCITALLFQHFPLLAIAVDHYFDLGREWLESVDRMYGFGAALDTAGARFSAVLIGITAMVIHVRNTRWQRYIWAYIIAFIFISVVGNMIARTTTIGVGLSILMIIVHLLRNRMRSGVRRSMSTFRKILLLSIAAYIVVTMLYRLAPQFQEDMRFAFEGFFSLVEKGTWEVASNDKLATMYVYPESTKTWLIGDGYFSNPYYTDPLFGGELVEGYYMGTDVGYLRFIFYFGLTGLAAFSWFFFVARKWATRISPAYKTLFIFTLLLNFAIWFKVATDMFVIFALFLMLKRHEDDEFMETIQLQE